MSLRSWQILLQDEYQDFQIQKNKFGKLKIKTYICMAMFNILRTRKGKLKEKIEYELESNTQDISKILNAIEEYERANLDTINKLRREKSLDIKRINGALKQTINAHGPITKDFIGSASKRIYGALLKEKNESFITKLLNIFR